MDSSFRRRVEAEYEAVERVLFSFPDNSLSELSDLELAGVATFLKNLSCK